MIFRLKYRLPSEIPLEEYPKPEEFIEEAKKLVEDAEKDGIILRVMGGLGIYLHLEEEEHKKLWKKLGRLGGKFFTDIDLASYSKYREKMIQFLTRKGYGFDPRLLYRYGKKRQIFFGTKIPMVEVFFDKLEMCHTISFKGRLEAEKITLPLAELLLEKLQIVKINEKDIKDIIVLLRSHEIGETDKETVNLKIFERAGLNKDWGFYYTVTTNFGKIKSLLDKYSVLSDEDRGVVSERIDKILNYLEKLPKTSGWKFRAKIGTKKKWYNDVEDWTYLKAEE